MKSKNAVHRFKVQRDHQSTQFYNLCNTHMAFQVVFHAITTMTCMTYNSWTALLTIPTTGDKGNVLHSVSQRCNEISSRSVRHGMLEEKLKMKWKQIANARISSQLIVQTQKTIFQVAMVTTTRLENFHQICFFCLKGVEKLHDCREHPGIIST